MAQLLKIANYVSRYERDIFHYAGQYTRMKRRRWEHMQKAYEGGGEIWGSGSAHIKSQKPLTSLKHEFREDIFLFQLRWASSTLQEKSTMDSRYRFDSWLKFFLLDFPDNYLFMYYPVLQVRQAAVVLDIVIIAPMDIYCLTLLDSNDGDVFQGNSGRFWRKIEQEEAVPQLSPLVSNLRMTRLVRSILTSAQHPMSVQRIILAPLAYIEYPEAVADVVFIDRRQARPWFHKMIRQPSPLKFLQMKTAQHLLYHCQTRSMTR